MVCKENAYYRNNALVSKSWPRDSMMHKKIDTAHRHLDSKGKDGSVYGKKFLWQS